MAVGGRSSLRISILKQYEDLKVIFLTEIKCKIRLIYVRFNCKRKKRKKWMEISAIKGGEGVRRLMANAIKNFHFVFLNPFLTLSLRVKIFGLDVRIF